MVFANFVAFKKMCKWHFQEVQGIKEVFYKYNYMIHNYL